MTNDLTLDRVRAAYQRVRDDLLAERNDRGHWTGDLSTSALSTATAVMALEQVRQAAVRIGDRFYSSDDVEIVLGVAWSDSSNEGPSLGSRLLSLIDSGLAWLAAHQNDDGGWGDTTKSFSNISTTMLCHAVFHATGFIDSHKPVIDRAKAYIDNTGGVPALIARYGKDKTFSVPILTHCALAGVVDWGEVQQLPFELACLPQRFYKTVRLPVVSYALPALIAIGQVRHHFRPTRVPGLRWLRNRAKRKSLDVLQRIQPSNGGFLEATPLTSFVTMSLAGMGLVDHPVVKKGVEFIVDSVRDDGSWPIDTNLATWVTTLSVNALGPDLPYEAREPILRWLLDQQYKEMHPYTGADPGGWSWTDLPGGVPDADDTPGAILAILELIKDPRASEFTLAPTVREGITGESDSIPSLTVGASTSISISDELVTQAHEAVRLGVKWLLDLQNRDGGWPTFCRGWGKLPFDRSSPDITAHCLRAFVAQVSDDLGVFGIAKPWPSFGLKDVDQVLCDELDRRCCEDPFGMKMYVAIIHGVSFLGKTQGQSGPWYPLWFGNQHASKDANPVYGTSRVTAAYRVARLMDANDGHKQVTWFLQVQNSDGGWGGDAGCPSSVEETALAIEVLLSDPSESSQVAARRGLLWLIDRVEDGTYREPTPIGFYFAKLWYFERLYPLIFTVAALRRACEVLVENET